MRKIYLTVALLLAVVCLAVACNPDGHDPIDTEDTTVSTHDTQSQAPVEDLTEAPTEEITDTQTDAETPTEMPTEAPTDAPEGVTYTVSFFVSGNVGSQPAPQTVKEGACASLPSVDRPEDGSTFNGWYTSPTLTPDTKFDFSTPITRHITLFAVITPPDTLTEGDLQPALVIDPAFLAAQVEKKDPLFSNEIGSAKLMTEYGHTFVRLTPDSKGVGDPYLTVIPVGWGTALPRYMAVSYRNGTHQTGEFFMGSGEGWTGQGDSFPVIWTTHGDWSLMIIDLTETSLTSITEDVINYCRLDFFSTACAAGESFDLEYVAFFQSAEAARIYDASLHRAPGWSTSDGAVIHHSFDQLYTGTGVADNGPENLFTPGTSAEWDQTVIFRDESVAALTYWGWIAVSGELGRFGYRIDLSTPVFDDSFTHTTEQAVFDAITAAGGATGSRLKIAIPLTGLKGIHTIAALYEADDGRIYTLGEFTLQMPGEAADSRPSSLPAATQYHTVNMSGMAGQVGFADKWPEAKIPTAHVKLGYGNVIDLGMMDLSLYTSVRITYCCDGSDTTRNAFAASSSLSIGLKMEASSYGQDIVDNLSGDIIHTDMVFSEDGWYAGARDAVIDLSDIRYKGNVWLSVHNPAGTEIVILGVEFTRRPEISLPTADLLDVQVVDGQVKDVSSMGFTVTATGTPSIGNGDEGPLMSFNRDGAYTVWNIGSLYRIMTEGFSMEITFTTGDDVTAYENLCANMQSGGFGFDYENGRITFCLKGADQTAYTYAEAAIQPNTTYHMVGVYDKANGMLLLYLNGRLAGSAAFTGDPVFAVNPDLVIGGDSGEGDNPEYLCDADIYFVRLYSEALSAHTVALLCDYR